jgi:ATP-dependent DNA helicase RecQ
VSIKAPKAAKARLQIDDADMDLWQLLRELRMALAQDQKVPPYVIFSDSSLLEMLHAKPQTLLEMSHVHGVGEKKLDRYGDDFLALIKQHA